MLIVSANRLIAISDEQCVCLEIVRIAGVVFLPQLIHSGPGDESNGITVVTTSRLVRAKTLSRRCLRLACQ